MNPDKESVETEDQLLQDGPLEAAPPDPDMGPDVIREWAQENLDRAKALGLRLIQADGAGDLTELDSLGDFEDKATEWAIAHPFKAKLLILSLVAELG